MTKDVIVTVIGGGSSQWMIALMTDFYLLDEVTGGEIRLVDPQTESVALVAQMLEAFNRQRNKSFRILIEPDRLVALRGAQFVVTTFSPGSMDAFENDLEIPLGYGIFQPVSMTVGPCGISAALRTVPVAYEIVEDMEKVCPGAWLLNLTNPMSVVTRAMNLAARTVKVVGLCHEVHALPRYLKQVLGLSKPEGVSTLEFLYHWLPKQGYTLGIAGINHCPWLTEFSHEGRDLLPQVRQFSKDQWGRGVQDAKYALCRTFGLLPLAGDRHLVEFVPSLCNLRNGFARRYGVTKTTVDARRHQVDKKRQQMVGIIRGDVPVVWEKSDEELTMIVGALLRGGSTPGTVNAPNRGQIANLPAEVIVETLADVSADGATPRPSGELPPAIAALMRLHTEVHELTVQAALLGDRERVVQAISLDPLSAQADFSELGALTDDLLSANRAWLPRFF